MPHWIANIVLFLSLGLDTLGVAIGLGLSGLGRRDRFRFGAAFSLAEGLMPLVGFVVGGRVAGAIGDLASYLAIALLFGVGLYTLWEAHGEEERVYEAAALGKLLLLALSVSIDELAVGFSLGLFHLPVLLTAGLIAAQAFLLTMIGTAAGRKAGAALAERAEAVSGVALTGLAVLLLGEKLAGA